jgi:NitT/TauT family transport system permease protein
MIRRALPPLVAGVVILAVWELWVGLADIQGFLLPPPSDIARSFGDQFDVLRTAAWATFSTAVKGLLVGSLAGVVIALLTSRFRWLGDGLTPMAIVAAATPIVVLAPIANIWFGVTDPMAKVYVVAIVTFFPVYLNTVRGLDAVPFHHLELLHSYGASRWTILVRARIPGSIPLLFVGLRLASSLAMITAIVAEYFGGSRHTLGVFITQRAAVVRFDEAWAGIVAACALALALYGAVVLLERLVAPWQPRDLPS